MEESVQMISVPFCFDGNNYLLWSNSIKVALGSHGLWNHLVSTHEVHYLANGVDATNGEGAARKSQQGFHSSEEREKWRHNEEVVLNILKRSMEESIWKTYEYVKTAKELWDTLSEEFEELSTICRVFEVKMALMKLQEEENEIKQPTWKEKSLLFELEGLRPPSSDSKEIAKRNAQDQVFYLITWLNRPFDELIKSFLQNRKIPTIEEMHSMVHEDDDYLQTNDDYLQEESDYYEGIIDGNEWSCDYSDYESDEDSEIEVKNHEENARESEDFSALFNANEILAMKEHKPFDYGANDATMTRQNEIALEETTEHEEEPGYDVVPASLMIQTSNLGGNHEFRVEASEFDEEEAYMPHSLLKTDEGEAWHCSILPSAKQSDLILRKC